MLIFKNGDNYMNNTEIAKKYGIKEILPYFFTEDCLKFYSKNDREII